MKSAIDEQISAFFDEELDPRELSLLAARLARDPDHRRKLARYGLIGDCLRGDTGLALPALALADRVRSALEQVPELPAVANGRPGRSAARWRRSALGVAAALLLSVGAVLQLQTPEAPGLSTAVVVPAAAPPAAEPAVVAMPVERRAAPARADTRMTNYLVYHGEYAGMLSSRAVASRIVDPESGAQWVPVRQVVLTND